MFIVLETYGSQGIDFTFRNESATHCLVILLIQSLSCVAFSCNLESMERILKLNKGEYIEVCTHPGRHEGLSPNNNLAFL